MNININGVSITLTQEQLNEIVKQTKPKEFEWGYKHGRTFMIQKDCVQEGYSGDLSHNINHGRYRKSKAVANDALLLNQRINRLHALVEQLGGLVKWEKDGNQYSIYFHNTAWNISSYSSVYNPERVYMTKECAEEICRMLNEGEFELNPKDN